MSKLEIQIESTLSEIKTIVRDKVKELRADQSKVKSQLKSDRSIVTTLDLFISELFKKKINAQFPEVSFYSEEDKGEFKFPICILDPLDGTKEFAAGKDEFCVSFGIYYSQDLLDERNFSWIYNPVTEEEISSRMRVEVQHQSMTFVSNTEYEANLHQEDFLAYKSVGSIAYKLLKLIHGECDLVISKRPKNIWDIAAGTHICLLNGIKAFEKELELKYLREELLQPELVWGLPQSCTEYFSNLKKN